MLVESGQLRLLKKAAETPPGDRLQMERMVLHVG